MEETISIEGTLLMLDDATPHAAVPVQAICDGEVIATVLSDERGRYQFGNLKPGRYKLRCQVLGGYVYYRATGDALRVTAYEKDTGEILHIENRKTLRNIDLRFVPFKKGGWKNYDMLDGLAHNRVQAIHRDPDGVMWFGTGGGVSRYDGKEFVNFTTENGLGDNVVWTVHSDSDGVMWFGTLGGGVSRYDGKGFINFTTEDGLVGNRISGIQHGSDGVMWFGTSSGVSRYDEKEFINFTTKDGLVHNRIRTIYRDLDGVIWFGTGGGVSRCDGKEFINFTTEDGLAGNSVGAIYRAPDGVMWFGTVSGGVSRYDGKEFVNFTTKDGLAGNRVQAIHRDPDGVMWFGTWEGGISRYDGRTFVNFTEKDGLASNIVLAIHRDPDGVMWFGTFGGGVSRYDEKTFVNFTEKDGLANNYALAIHRNPDGVMWFGTQGGGVSRYDEKTFVNFTEKDGLASNWVWAIHRAPDGIVWFGAGSYFPVNGGISRYDGKEFVNLTTEDGLAGGIVRAIHRDPDGVMWFGADSWGGGGGVSRYDGKGFVNFTEENGLADNGVYAIHRDPDGVMWFGTKGGVSRYDGKEFVSFTTEDGLADGSVDAIYNAPDGVMWFGTNGGGVSKYDGKEFVNFTTEDGLVNSFVEIIYGDPDGAIWFGTDCGISCYDGVAWMSLDTRDGLAGNWVSSIYQDPDGFLWFATDKGVTRYRRSTVPPKVHIVSVTTDQTYGDLTAVPAFTPDIRVIIEYNSIDLKTVPEKRQYRFRIKEIDLDWRKPTKATSFGLIFDEPGTYTFEVQAIDRDLNYSELASVKLEVITDPRNHQIAQLKGELVERERAELERVHQELEDARQIQQSLLPEKPPEVEGFEMAGTSLPAREVSGDFYNYLSLGENVGIVLADVTGKSVKAAMVAALTDGMLSEVINAQREFWHSPSRILRRLNTGIQPRLIRGMYAAMSLGIIHVGERQFVFSNSGMPYPIVKRDKKVWELAVNGMPLGLMDKAEYQDLSLDLKEGDLVVFYSDGVIEAENEAGEMYQTERLLELMQAASSALSAQEMVDLIMGDVTAFVGDEEASDDVTVVVLQCKE